MSGAIAERLDAITKRANIKKREVADMLNTTPETVSRWRAGRVDPQPVHRDLLLQLDWLIGELSEIYTEPGDANIWLYSRNKLLGGKRPVDLIKENKIDEVLRVIAQLKDGAFV